MLLVNFLDVPASVFSLNSYVDSIAMIVVSFSGVHFYAEGLFFRQH